MSVRNFDDDLLVEICHRFLEGGNTTQQIAKAINHDWSPPQPLTREQVYPAIREGQRRGFFSLRPPLNSALRETVARKYDLPPDRLHVVPVRGNGALEIVADVAADLIVQLIREASQTKSRVHVGLGAGGTLTQVAQKLAARLRSEAEVPPLALHALSSGFNVERPETAPVSFFSSFHGAAPDIKYFGLFAPAVIAARNYERETRRRGVAESFRRADDIDIVVTALAWAEDSDGELTHYIEDSEELKRMREQGWVGDVLYRPYSENGPLRGRPGVRAVSLFELSELVDRAQRPGKHVVLVAAPCAYCGKRKGEALRPLLVCPELRVWSEIVMDIPTAEQLLVDPAPSRRHPRPSPRGRRRPEARA